MSEEMVRVLEQLAKIITKLESVEEKWDANRNEIKEIGGRVKNLESWRDTSKGGQRAMMIAVSVGSTILGIIATLLALLSK